MKKSKVVPLGIPDDLDELASLGAREEHTDKATALRQWLHQGAAHYVLKLVAEGRISLNHGAELLGARSVQPGGIARRRVGRNRRTTPEIAPVGSETFVQGHLIQSAADGIA